MANVRIHTPKKSVATLGSLVRLGVPPATIGTCPFLLNFFNIFFKYLHSEGLFLIMMYLTFLQA